jgi:DNA modification methylase
MPNVLAEFFMRFLTDETDLVLDPFAGSNTSGAVAERLNRQWVSLEAEWDYVTSSLARFDPDAIREHHRLLRIHRLDHATSSSSGEPLASSLAS